MKFWKKAAALLTACALSAGILTSCGGVDPASIDYVQMRPPTEGQDIAIIDTTLGNITIQLYTEEVPTLVNNFKELVERGFYDGQIIFHVEPHSGLVAAGSSTPDGMGGDSSTGKPIEATYSTNLWPFTGSVSMVCYEAGMLWKKSMYCDSRFFMLDKTEVSEENIATMKEYHFPAMMKNIFQEQGGVPQFGRLHSVFGKVIDGMEVVEAIRTAELRQEPIEIPEEGEEPSGTPEQLSNNRPVEDVVINSIRLSAFHAADFDELDNTLSPEELEDLIYRSNVEQQEQDEALSGNAPAKK